MRIKIILILLAFIVLICAYCNNVKTRGNTSEIIEVTDTVKLAKDSIQFVAVDTLMIQGQENH